MDGRKSYRFTLRWGEATETDDAEGRIVEQHTHRPQATEIRAVLPQFTGEIEQIPPLYSAIKVGGRRAYDLARAPTEFELKPRRVTAHAITLERQRDGETAPLAVQRAQGTNLRAPARDLGGGTGPL